MTEAFRLDQFTELVNWAVNKARSTDPASLRSGFLSAIGQSGGGVMVYDWEINDRAIVYIAVGTDGKQIKDNSGNLEFRTTMPTSELYYPISWSDAAQQWHALNLINDQIIPSVGG